jgi:hypothetical protein
MSGSSGGAGMGHPKAAPPPRDDLTRLFRYATRLRTQVT